MNRHFKVILPTLYINLTNNRPAMTKGRACPGATLFFIVHIII
jgi:hypothetical protein